jgi:aspartate racemase
MKTLGLLGGMSWESSVEYYRLINQNVRDRLGGLHSAQLLMWSFDFHEVEELQSGSRWNEARELLVAAADRLKTGGAEILVICCNTMHLMADDIERATGLPLVHIADATAAAVKDRGVRRVALLGTGYTMEKDFYRGRMVDRHGLEVLIPEPEDRKVVHDVIYEELCRGIVRPESRARYLEIVGRLRVVGAEGLILGCTEIGMLIGDQQLDLPVFDSLTIHAAAAADAALA